jgi:hypothetical protein
MRPELVKLPDRPNAELAKGTVSTCASQGFIFYFLCGESGYDSRHLEN